MFLEVLWYCLCIFRRNHLLHSLLTSFKREIPSPASLAWDSEAFSDIFYNVHFLFLLRGEFLKLYVFSQSHKARLGVDNLPFVFFNAAPRNVQVYEIFSNPAVRPAFSTCLLTISNVSLSLYVEVGTESWPYGGGRSMDEV